MIGMQIFACQKTFNLLCEHLSPFLSKEGTKLRKAISVEKRVAVSLWRLATNADYQTIVHLFGISKSSVGSIVEEFCEGLSTQFVDKYIRIPSGEKLDKVVHEFKTKWGFPQCFGAVDGSHIPIKAPVEFHTDYYNRKGWYSIILQAVVDGSYKFIDINVGWPGKVHDARGFANSTIYRKGQSGNLLEKDKIEKINGVNMPLVILPDAAYPLLPWVMKPFSANGKLSQKQLHFNYRLSRARMVVENAFGRLKGRWRCLLKQNEASIQQMNQIVTACCILHNICEINREKFDEALCSDQHEPSTATSITTSETQSARADEIRKALVEYCFQNTV